MVQVVNALEIIIIEHKMRGVRIARVPILRSGIIGRYDYVSTVVGCHHAPQQVLDMKVQSWEKAVLV